MKRTCLFNKSAGGDKVSNDPMEGVILTVNNPSSTPTSSTTAPINTTNNSNWFTRNKNEIGAGLFGLASGMLLTAYLIQKLLDRDMRLLLKRKEENQKEENNKTV